MKRILVCEDEDSIREFVVLNLKRSGYDVVDVSCGEDAIKAFDDADGAFDAVLLDIMMPGIDGFAVCRQLRERSDNIGIIMLSAKSQEMDKVSSLMIGADDYITKPFSISELIARVDAICRRVSLVDSKADKQNVALGTVHHQLQEQSGDKKRRSYRPDAGGIPDNGVFS